MIRDFKEFIMRGNVVDLAVAVVVAGAFGDVVNSLVADLITPLIAAIGGAQDFSGIKFTINNSEFMIGNFVNQVVAFVMIAFVVFFFIVKPMNLIIERTHQDENTADPTTGICTYCRSEIALEATRCPRCTSKNPLQSTAYSGLQGD
jgi:large conductance mechanosensitive channel